MYLRPLYDQILVRRIEKQLCEIPERKSAPGTRLGLLNPRSVFFAISTGA
jgi:hypothetical protein